MWDCGGVLKHFLLLSYFHPIRLLYTPSSASRRFQITPSLVSSGLWFYVNHVFINRCRWMIPFAATRLCLSAQTCGWGGRRPAWMICCMIYFYFFKFTGRYRLSLSSNYTLPVWVGETGEHWGGKVKNAYGCTFNLKASSACFFTERLQLNSESL